MKKIKYLLYLVAIVMMFLLPSTYAACTHPFSYSDVQYLKINKVNHCRTVLKVKKCSSCRSVTKILGTTKQSTHVWNSKVITPASCNQKGTTKFECTRCNYSYTTKTNSLTHKSSDYIESTKQHWKYCSRCGKTYNRASHKFNSNYKCTTCGYVCKHPTVTEATCSKDGKCTLCGYVKTSKLGHKLSGFIANAEKGHYRKCTRIGCTYKSQESTHGILDGTCVKCGYVKVCKHANKIFPTCTKAGSCKDCGTIFSKLGHNYIGGVCNRTNCNAKEPVKEPTKDTENIEDIVINPSDPGSAATCTHGVKSSVTCTKPSTCIKCGMEFGEPLPHDYVYDEWNISNEYHYVFCQICWRPDTIKTEKHSFASDGKCSVCGYTKGSKVEVVDAPEILECDHGNSTLTVVIKEPTCIDEGEEEVKCVTCDYSKVNVLPKINFHTYDPAAGYRVTVKYHQMRCTGCAVADSNNREEHDFNKDGICKVCEYICRHPSCDEGVACSYCGYAPSGTCTKHTFETKIDGYGHWLICSVCGYQDNSVGVEKCGIHVYKNADGNKKDNDSNYTAIDLGNGKHARKCEYCEYKLETVHLWVDDKCSICGSKNLSGIQSIHNPIMEYNPEDKKQIKTLQEHLTNLGYYNSGVDAVWGKGTFDAVNELLAAHGCSIELNYDEKWNGITPEIYTLIMNCKETKAEGKIREFNRKIENNEEIKHDELLEITKFRLKNTGYYATNKDSDTMLLKTIRAYLVINGLKPETYNLNNIPQELLLTIINDTSSVEDKLIELMNKETELLTEEQNELFNNIILLALSTETSYDMNDATNRVKGAKNFFEYFSTDTPGEMIYDVSTFDCSSFSSTVMNLVFGISCNNGSYNTTAFRDDEKNFIREPVPKEGIDISTLKKGQLILCTGNINKGANHIMVYLGNGLIAHSNSTSNGVAIDELSLDNTYTDIFLKPGIGYNNIYILTPKQAK